MKNNSDKINVIVCDDSPFMRKALTKMLQSDSQIQVVATASNGKELLETIKKIKADLITLDLEMPVMNGLETLKHIKKFANPPVLMISSSTSGNAKAIMEALALGAVDYLLKKYLTSSLDIMSIQKELANKVKSIVTQKKFSAKSSADRSSSSVSKASQLSRKIVYRKIAIIAIGASTGGPMALQTVFSALPENIPVPIVVTQHIPKNFSEALGEYLNSICALTIKTGEHGEMLMPGTVYLAPGDKDMSVKKETGCVRINLSTIDNTHQAPSIDLLFSSVADIYRDKTLGVILTGMGIDGIDGVKKLKENGGICIAQDEASSVIYGIGRTVTEAGLADSVLPLTEIPGEILKLLQT